MNVLECLVADAQLNQSLGLRDSGGLQYKHSEYRCGKAVLGFLGEPVSELRFH